MTRQTRLWFVVGLLVTLLAVPVIAVAVTSPSTVSEGTTFNASDGPEVILGETATIDVSRPFPAADTVDLGVANVSGGNATTTLVGIESGSASSSLTVGDLSASQPVQLARDDTALSIAATSGNVTAVELVSGATVGDGLSDIGVSTGDSAGTVTVRGLSGSLDAVTFVDADTGDIVDSAAVTSGTATLSLSQQSSRTLAISTVLPEIEGGSPDGTTITPGETVTLTADITHQSFPSETVDVEFYELQTGDPSQDPLLGTGTLQDNGTVSTDWTVNFGPAAQWYVRAEDSAGAVTISDAFTIQVEAATVDLDISPDDQDILTDDSVVIPQTHGTNPSVETEIGIDWNTSAYSELRVRVIDGNQTEQVNTTITSPQTLTPTIQAISESQASFVVRVNDTGSGDLVAASRSHTYYIPRIELRNLRGDPVDPDDNVSVSISDQNGPVRVSNATLSNGSFWLAEILTDTRRGARTYSLKFAGRNGFEDETHISDDWRAFPTQFVYLRNASQLDSPFQVTFELVDRSGRFDSNQTALRLERQINGTWATVATGIFGANDRVTRALEENASYRVEVQNTQLGERREFGRYVPRIEGEFVQLEVGEIDLLPDPPDPVVATDARLDADEQTLRWSISWNESQADNAVTDVSIRHPDNSSLYLFNQTVVGTDNRTVTIPLSDAQASEDWIITWNISYTDPQSGERISLDREQYLGGIGDLGVPVSDMFLQVVSILSLLLLAGLFGGQLATIGGIVVVGAAWLLRAVGFLVVPVEFLVAATVIAVLLRLGTVEI